MEAKIRQETPKQETPKVESPKPTAIVPANIKIDASVGSGETKKSATVFVSANFDTLDGLKSYGLSDSEISELAKKSLIIAVQNEIRKGLDANETPEAIQTRINNWKYGTAVRRVSGGSKKVRLNAMSIEELTSLLDAAKAALDAKK